MAAPMDRVLPDHVRFGQAGLSFIYAARVVPDGGSLDAMAYHSDGTQRGLSPIRARWSMIEGRETMGRFGMARSRIKYFKSSDLALPRDLLSVLIRLMLAENDISLAADANDFWAETSEQRRVHLKERARRYFIRLIMSHVHEALKIIEEINKNPNLKAAVDQCDARTGENFRKLVAILNSRERGQLNRFRNNATFHYDKETSADHLQAVIAADPTATWSYSVGSTPLDWSFELGDAVMDRMVVRFVLGADEPRSAARTQKVDEIAMRVYETSTTFTNFAQSFIERHIVGAP